MVNSINKKATPKRTNNGSFIFFVLSVILLLEIILLDNSKNAGRYEWLFIMPIWFCIMCVVTPTFCSKILKSPVAFFVFGGYFVKMVLTPTLFAVGGFRSFYRLNFTESDITKTILFMCLENAVVFLISQFCLQKDDTIYEVRELKSSNYNSSVITLAIVGLVAFIIFAFNYVPEISEIYYFLFDVDFGELAEIQWDNEQIVPRGTIKRYIYSLYCFLWPVARGILPAFCMVQVFKKFGHRKISYILSALSMFIPALILGGDNIAPFLGVVFGGLTFYRLYGKRAVKLIASIAILFGIGLVIIVLSKMELYETWRGARGVAPIAQLFNSYFPGVDNISVGFWIDNPDKMSTMFFDIYYAIPFKETLFGLSGEYLGNYYTAAANVGGQILPWSTQLSHYFGITGSCIVTALFVRSAYATERKSRETDDFWSYYLYMYLSVLIAVSISIYSVSIFIRNVVNVVVPLLIIIKVGNRRKKIESKKMRFKRVENTQTEDR